jgi:hypothetical protein|tara:strand:+ start:6118 stop:7020 length:903 start_codon:yes stop_codon:yes gene_type:complete
LIKLLTEKIGGALLLAIAILTGFGLIMGDSSISMIAKLILLLVEGLLLNYLCFRFGILGINTNLPLVLFCTLTALVVPQLSMGDIIYGGVFLGALFLAFESREHRKLSSSYMIYFGVLLGIAQAFSNISLLMMLPVFILFAQAGTRRPRHFILSFTYFAMVIISISGLLFVMELEHRIWELIPSLSFDYSVFNTIVIKLTVPFILICLIIHFLSLNSYRFRYPNKSIIFNYTMLLQLACSILLVILTAELDILMYAIMAASTLLSFVFGYKQDSTFINSAFASLISICMMSLFLYKILIL